MLDSGPVRKVVAYITREINGREELLVFRHRDNPEAGVQVPAGTVEEGEDVDAAVAREAGEETGLHGFQVQRKIGVFMYDNKETGRLNERHVYHLLAPEGTPDTWQWIETGGGRVSSEEGYVFLFSWADFTSGIELAGNQGDYLQALTTEKKTAPHGA